MNLHEIKSGFQLNAVRHIEDQQGDLYEFEHVKTGAQLVWMKRADENKTFCIGFKTIPENDTGVFHICEHSVLNGSRKYPVREPFVDLLNGSMQTFLNAMTYPDKTIYPVSSRNPKDFLNLMDVYLDAVFHPAIYTNPNIFYQEGWHYEIHKEDEIPTYKGVVFNEMKGAFASVDELISNETARMLFRDNCYQYVSGGDPVHIPDLSYEQFKKAHSTFYHPSNARIFLDGDLDIDAALEEIDSYLRDYTKQEVSFDIPMQKETPYEEHTIGYEIGDEEDPAGKTVVSISTLLSDYSDVKEDIAWNILTSLLAGSNDAPLKKVILEKGLGQDVEVSLLDGIEQFVLTFLVRNTDADKKDEILDAIYGTLGNLAEHGLDHAQLQASLNHQEFMYYSQRAYEMLFRMAYTDQHSDKKGHIVVKTPVTFPVQNYAVHKIPDIDHKIENTVMCVMLRGALLPSMIMSKEIQEYSSHGYKTPFALFKISRNDTKNEADMEYIMDLFFIKMPIWVQT